jgi:methionyl-tRNA formyltransferase
VQELDAGPIAAQRAFGIEEDDDAGAVYRRSAEVAAELLGDLVAQSHKLEFRAQEGEPTYAQKLESSDRELDLTDPVDAQRRVRALSPHIGARAELHGRPLTIWRSRLDDGRFVPVEVQPAGGRRMTYEEFLRGLR